MSDEAILRLHAQIGLKDQTQWRRRRLNTSTIYDIY